jgi:hypothetical protein
MSSDLFARIRASTSSPRRPRVRRGLEFVEDERGHDEPRLEDSGLGQVGDPAVDDARGVEHVGPEATDIAGELDERDQEAEVVPRLQEQTRADVAEHGAEDQGQPLADR